MKLPINWLKEYVKVDNPQELIEKMTSIGHMQDGSPKNVNGDIVYDLEIRQNRPDCLSIIGLAREAAAILNKKLKNPLNEFSEINIHDKKIDVTIDDPSLCYRFKTFVIEGIKIQPSPDWLVNKLIAYGIKPINNIIDITNYVMVEVGEPLHAFDIRDITENKIIIRRAKKGESIIVIGGKKVALTEDDLLVTDPQKPLGLAGIIGGDKTGVKNDTTTIVLEGATYNQATIRRSSIRHSLRTEASTRHEKFLHPHLAEMGLRRAVQLIEKLAGGKVTGQTDCYPTPEKDISIAVSLENINKTGGINIDVKKSVNILKSLEIDTEDESNGTISTKVPYFRTDLIQEADIVEEVLRLFGYDNIPERLPSLPPPKYIQSKTYDLEEEIRDILVACGFDEEITEPLTNEENPALNPVKLENSLSSEKIMLRTTLKESLLKAFGEQQKHRKNVIEVFEVGKIYFMESEEYKEQRIVGGISSYKDNSYTHLKGVIELLFAKLGYEYNENVITIEPINNNSFFFQINIDQLLSGKKVTTQKVLTSPPQLNLQDISIVVEKAVPVGNIVGELKDISPLVYSVSLGEEPQMINENEKSVFLHIAFSSPDKTLTNEDVEPIRESIIQLLKDKHHARLR
ncbi:MAG: phenylalanine--tRNA ligase subunit beta [Candidatus Roizmanbacteria bacterium]|nr:MAG: phenylalanine--tRNA ligase subunit beta [Candidatus Roizmanbacteria bacterium]